jgi:hypothetical protein
MNYPASGKNKFLYLLTKRVMKLSIVIIVAYHTITSYKILSNILLSRLIPYADEIVRDHQRGFRRNKSTADQIFYVRQILEKRGSIMVQYISCLFI